MLYLLLSCCSSVPLNPLTRHYVFACAAWVVAGVCYAQQSIPPANFDEANVPKFELTDPLKIQDGRIVNTPELWNNIRRPELLALFEKEMFGKAPLPSLGNRGSMAYKVAITQSGTVFGDKGQRYLMRFQLSKNEKFKDSDPTINVLIYAPNQKTEKTPIFIGLNFRGNHTVGADPDIPLSTVWKTPKGGWDGMNDILVPQPAKEEERGSQARRWTIEKILDRGYAVATAYYGDIEPDFDGGSKFGFRQLIDQKGEPDEGNAIATWAWGLSMIREVIALNPGTFNIDPKKIAVIGHSRLGKTALWAGAIDPEFAMVISNDSGCGGAALSRREYGETLLLINSARPHWYCGNFKKYNLDVNSLPFDQHELVSLIAPRPVYIASAEEDRWADPKGEFLSGLYADPVYRLLGTDGIAGAREMPDVDKPIGGTIGYHVRTGKHDITEYDWEQFLNFADKHLR